MKKSIPKIIHYCWFGKGPKPKLVLKCIASWQKYLPDYEIKEWNENNFDINSNVYCKEAYERKKYAFVSDYVRLYAIYNEGGIYFDTDLEVIKNLDKFLNNVAFTGFENNEYAFTAVFGAIKHSKWIKKLLDYYDNRHFVDKYDSMDLTPNTQIVTQINIQQFHLKNNNTYQDLKDFVIYPSDYFSPKSWETGDINITPNTYTIHHFNASWHGKDEKKLRIKKQKYIEKYGPELGLKKYERYYKLKEPIIRIKRVIKNPKLIIKKVRGKK